MKIALFANQHELTSRQIKTSLLSIKAECDFELQLMDESDATQFNVSFIPSVLLLDDNGNEADRVVGCQGIEILRAQLTKWGVVDGKV